MQGAPTHRRATGFSARGTSQKNFDESLTDTERMLLVVLVSTPSPISHTSTTANPARTH